MVYSKAKSFRCNTYKKHRGGGALADRPPLCASVPLWQSLHLPRVTEHGSRATPSALSVPLQPNAFGATIRKGTGILHHPGKQLRSPRCLRIESGHREVFTTSRLQVVPGSIVLKLDRSRVARVPIREGWVKTTASAKDAGKCRVGKVGSVRLG